MVFSIYSVYGYNLSLIHISAFTEKDMAEIVKICDHIVFNSFSQWDMHKNTVQNSGRNIECGIRINPEYSEIETDIYNPVSYTHLSRPKWKINFQKNSTVCRICQKRNKQTGRLLRFRK